MFPVPCINSLSHEYQFMIFILFSEQLFEVLFALVGVDLVIMTHSLKGFLVSFILKVLLMLVIVLFLFLFLFLLFSVFLVKIDYYFGRLKVLLFIDKVDLLEEFLLRKTFESIVDHVDGQLNLQSHILLQLSFTKIVENLVDNHDQRVPM